VARLPQKRPDRGCEEAAGRAAPAFALALPVGSRSGSGPWSLSCRAPAGHHRPFAYRDRCGPRNVLDDGEALWREMSRSGRGSCSGRRWSLPGRSPGSWLASVSLGRIVFTRHAMPAIRPVNHLVDDQTIIVRSHLGAAIVERAAAEDGAVVCHEADELDPVRHTGVERDRDRDGQAGPRPRSDHPARADAGAMGGRPDGLRHRHQAPGHHRAPAGGLVPLTDPGSPGRPAAARPIHRPPQPNLKP
jgi:Pyridoxamine 5'-phosphate oxidase